MAKKQSIIKPSLVFENDSKEHILQQLLDKDNAPIIKSIGYMRVPDANTYVSYLITSQGDKIISIEVEEPNLKAIAEESAKLSFVTSFMDKD